MVKKFFYVKDIFIYFTKYSLKLKFVVFFLNRPCATLLFDDVHQFYTPLFLDKCTLIFQNNFLGSLLRGLQILQTIFHMHTCRTSKMEVHLVGIKGKQKNYESV